MDSHIDQAEICSVLTDFFSEDSSSTVSAESVASPALIASESKNGRIFAWSSKKNSLLCITRIARNSDAYHSFSPPPPSDEQGSSDSRSRASNVTALEMHLSSEIKFDVKRMIVNPTSKLLALIGRSQIMAVDISFHTPLLIHRNSTSVSCRSLPVGGDTYESPDEDEQSGIAILHAEWHPLSDIHLCILSADSGFRIFDVANMASVAEQEYMIEGPGMGLVSPVSFSFGGPRLWEMFAVFILFDHGALAALCPVLPFGSRLTRSQLAELLQHAELELPPVLSAQAATWLKGSFPALFHQSAMAAHHTAKPSSVVTSTPFVYPHAPLCLQGPLLDLSDPDSLPFGPPISHSRFLLSTAPSIDTLLIDSCSASGTIRVQCVSGDVLPLWDSGAPKPWPAVEHKPCIWMQVTWNSWGQDRGSGPPSLGTVTLGIVDLQLAAPSQPSPASWHLVADPRDPRKILCSHPWGVDSVFVRRLPFSGEGMEEGLAAMDVSAECGGSEERLLAACCVEDMAHSAAAAAVWLFAAWEGGRCTAMQLSPPPLSKALSVSPLSAMAAPGFSLLDQRLDSGLTEVPAVAISVSPTLLLDSWEGREELLIGCKLLNDTLVEYCSKAYAHIVAKAQSLHAQVNEQDNERRELQKRLEVRQQRCSQLRERVKKSVSHVESLVGQAHRCWGSIRPLCPDDSWAERNYMDTLDATAAVYVPQLKAAVAQYSTRLRRVLKKEREEEDGLGIAAQDLESKVDEARRRIEKVELEVGGVESLVVEGERLMSFVK